MSNAFLAVLFRFVLFVSAQVLLSQGFRVVLPWCPWVRHECVPATLRGLGRRGRDEHPEEGSRREQAARGEGGQDPEGRSVHADGCPGGRQDLLCFILLLACLSFSQAEPTRKPNK